MKSEYQISASCIISGGTISKNGETLLSSTEGIDAFLTAAYHHLEGNYPKFYKMDNLSKLGWLAAEVLLKDSFDSAQYQPFEIGVVLANANSSLDADMRYIESIKEFASPALFVYTLPNIVIGEICIRHKFKGENLFFIQPEFDAEAIATQVDYLLREQKLTACVCGWADVLGAHYKAGLFLVEQSNGGQPFNAENMNRLFTAI
ncbi:hypothetical protein C8P68_102499 [Mucilaginibacter yixingensis]|uniref:Beta-ketoacyl synthase-like protein n=1 Tax=Mucilaginibacter yixingensis TaxID=1295612 RepID=A0A2T5JD20_9SPHI|nr:hypothetical protein [Mucilaginibacter yixingensis]PTQ99671.1 hypothetical protein C8P68_102499 [Mucilaginibacter yixingensis]